MPTHEFLIYYLNYHSKTSHELLYEIWEQLCEDGLVETLFYDGSIECQSQFYREILRLGCLPFAVFSNGQIAAFTWLNCISGKSAKTHFVIFKQFWGKRLRTAIGRHVWNYILSRKDRDGYLLDSIYGITPVSYALAIKAAVSCGWKKCGEIPNACWLAHKCKSEAGIITCATREFLNTPEEVRPTWEI